MQTRVYGSAFKTNATGKARIKHYVSNAIYKIAGPKNIDKKRNDIFRKVSIESSNEIGLVSFISILESSQRTYTEKMTTIQSICEHPCYTAQKHNSKQCRYRKA